MESNSWIDIDVCGTKLPARVVLWLIYLLDFFVIAVGTLANAGDILDAFVLVFGIVAGGFYLIIGIALLNLKGSVKILEFYGKFKKGLAGLLALIGIYCVIYAILVPSLYFIITIFVGLGCFGDAYFVNWQSIIWKRALKALIGNQNFVGIPLNHDQLQQPIIILVQPLNAFPNMGIAAKA
eukprot:TRINITY_DN3635_c0_g1_i2.p1 TRINITY_DN3635_c0_g1~~TRINITY_DN3635_c0_g1_i2.p1  ORF type:complete len:181 (+),score=28.35 TRINITY_DN3635_c0_g1_i2:128-670(+)